MTDKIIAAVKLSVVLVLATSLSCPTHGQVLDTGDKVGIGINPPLEKLHVNGHVRGGGPNGELSISTGNGILSLGPRNTSWAHIETDRPKFYFSKPVTVDGGISSYYTNNLFLQTADITRLTILNSNGYVGIGTNAPSGLLEIKGPYSGSSQLIINTTSSNGELKFSDNGTTRGYVWFSKVNDMMAFGRGNTHNSIFVNASGNVGVGVAPATSAKFEVAGPSTGSAPTIRASGGGDVLMNSGGSLFFDGNYSYAYGNYIRPLAANTQAFFTSGVERLRITPSGNIGIGTPSPTEKLTVNGTIYGKEVRVDLNVLAPDYVFKTDYDLVSLQEVKAHIEQHGHLPEVPSATEMEEEGINVGEMNMILLKKIEELTLYLLQQQSEIERLRLEIQESKP